VRRRINLVPPAERTRTTTDVGLLLMLVLAIVVVFGLGFGYYLLDNQRADRQQRLSDLQEQVAQVQKRVAALRQYEVVKAQKDEVETLVTGIYGARTTMSDILSDISLVVPETIWFQNLNLTAADPVLQAGGGAARSASDPTTIGIQATTYTFEDVAQLLIRLQLVPSLKNVELVSARDDAQGTTETAALKTFSMQGSIVDTSLEEGLPVSEIQVETP